MGKDNKHKGSSLDEFLKNENVFDEFQAAAIKNVVVFQIEQIREEKGLSKRQMAKAMKTSRAQLDRLLNPDNENVTLKTLQRAASVLGKEIRIDLV